jgi:hypothetical protein
VADQPYWHKKEDSSSEEEEDTKAKDTTDQKASERNKDDVRVISRKEAITCGHQHGSSQPCTNPMGAAQFRHLVKSNQAGREENAEDTEDAPAEKEPDPRGKYKTNSNACWRKDWSTLNKRQVEYNQAQRDAAFDGELRNMTNDLSRFIIERHTGKGCEEWLSRNRNPICVGTVVAIAERLKADVQMRNECNDPRWHGVPIPMLEPLIEAGEATPWPWEGMDPNDLDRSWWSKDYGLALSYGGPVEIGDGWMISCALATVADDFLGPNFHQRAGSYASKRVVLSGGIYAQASHIAQLSWGEGRYLPLWSEFPWDGAKTGSRRSSQS